MYKTGVLWSIVLMMFSIVSIIFGNTIPAMTFFATGQMWLIAATIAKELEKNKNEHS